MLQTLDEALTSATELRAIYNSLSPPNAVSLGGLDLPRGEAEDAYHFVVYLPVHGDSVRAGRSEESSCNTWSDRRLVDREGGGGDCEEN